MNQAVVLDARAARRKIGTYLLLTLGLSAVFWVLLIRAGTLETHGGAYVVALMWCPGVAALLTRLLHQRNLRGEGWRWGGTRWQAAAYALPLGYAGVAYGSVWLLGLGGVRTPGMNLLGFVTLGSAQSCLFALGEELGWRGLLVPELARVTTFTRTAFLSGLIWAAWHLPLILFADYSSGTPAPYAVACFAVMVVGISFPMAWLRLRSGSVWSGMFLHASHNLWIQGFFDVITVDSGHTLWFTTEFGAALAVTGALTGYLFWRLRDRLPRGASGNGGSAEPAPVISTGSSGTVAL